MYIRSLISKDIAQLISLIILINSGNNFYIGNTNYNLLKIPQCVGYVVFLLYYFKTYYWILF